MCIQRGRSSRLDIIPWEFVVKSFGWTPPLFSFFFFFFAKKVSFLAAQLNQPGRSNSIPVSEKGEEEGEREGGYN